MERDIPGLALKPEDYAAIYARKSIKTENNSIQSQLSLARDILLKNDLILYKEYWDEESATKLPPHKRQGFSELLKDAKAGKFKTVIAFRRDRLARKANDLLEIKNLFKKLQIKIIYSNSGEYQPCESYLSDFIENIIMAVDELEPQIVAERTKTGRIKKRERREYFSANIPFGYIRKIEGNKSQYLYEQCKQGIIDFIFSKYREIDENFKLIDLVKEVNLIERVEPPLTAQKVINIIKNPIYAGHQFKDSTKGLLDLFSLCDDGHTIFNIGLLQKCSNVTPAISFERWCECIKKWRENYKLVTKSASQSYLLKGMLFCGKCSKSMSLSSQQYRCRTKYCTVFNASNLQAEFIQALVEDIIVHGGFPNYVGSKISGIKHEIQKLNRELKYIANKVENHTIEFIKKFNNEENAIYEKNHILGCLTEQERIKDQINILENKAYKLNGICANTLSVSNSGLARHLLSNQEKTQMLLSSLIEKVIVYGEKGELAIKIT